jgi:hypothetical protein
MMPVSVLVQAQMAQKKKLGPLGGGGDQEKSAQTEKRRVLDAKDCYSAPPSLLLGSLLPHANFHVLS